MNFNSQRGIVKKRYRQGHKKLYKTLPVQTLDINAIGKTLFKHFGVYGLKFQHGQRHPIATIGNRL